jgi:hypothetical protein
VSTALRRTPYAVTAPPRRLTDRAAALAFAAPLVPDALASPLDSVTPIGAPEERSRARWLATPCARATPAWPSVPSTTAARARARDGA